MLTEVQCKGMSDVETYDRHIQQKLYSQVIGRLHLRLLWMPMGTHYPQRFYDKIRPSSW